MEKRKERGRRPTEEEFRRPGRAPPEVEAEESGTLSAAAAPSPADAGRPGEVRTLRREDMDPEADEPRSPGGKTGAKPKRRRIRRVRSSCQPSRKNLEPVEFPEGPPLTILPRRPFNRLGWTGRTGPIDAVGQDGVQSRTFSRRRTVETAEGRWLGLSEYLEKAREVVGRPPFVRYSVRRRPKPAATRPAHRRRMPA